MGVFRFWRVGLGAAIALTVTAAFATDPVNPYPECTRKPTPADTEGARGAHKAASQFYERGDYEKAYRYWSDAYGFDCMANDLLINIANAQEKKGDRPGAIVTLETYLKRSPPNPTLEEKVKNLKQLLAPPVPSAPPPASVATPPAATASASAPPVDSAPLPPPHDPQGPRPYGLYPWFVAGGGAAATVVGLILLPVGASSISSLNTSCPNRTCPPRLSNAQALADQGNMGRAEVGVGIAALSVGVLALGGGMVWQLLYNKPRPKTETPVNSGVKVGVDVAPLVGPGIVGGTVGGTF